MLKNCEICNKEFKCRPSRNQRFCSRACVFVNCAKKRTYECIQCKQQYQIKPEAKKPRNLKRTFCSYKCAGEHQRGANNHQWRGVKETRQCINCNKDFVVKNTSRKSTARYCSIQCRTIHYDMTEHPSDHKVWDKCKHCEKIIKITNRKIGKRNFCSQDCANKAHSFWIKGKNNGRYVHGDHAVPYPSGWTKTYKQQIRERDHHQCKVCLLKQEDHNVLLHVHHIDYNKNNINTDNLITLCKYCHGKMHGNTDGRLKWKAKLLNLLEGSNQKI